MALSAPEGDCTESLLPGLFRKSLGDKTTVANASPEHWPPVPTESQCKSRLTRILFAPISQWYRANHVFSFGIRNTQYENGFGEWGKERAMSWLRCKESENLSPSPASGMVSLRSIPCQTTLSGPICLCETAADAETLPYVYAATPNLA